MTKESDILKAATDFIEKSNTPNWKYEVFISKKIDGTNSWELLVRWKTQEGSIIDGPCVIHVDEETLEARNAFTY